MNTIQEKAESVLASLQSDDVLAKYIDVSYPIPQVYQGSGTIKLIVLGQDPTVQDASARIKIKTVLNLDKNGSVRAYLSGLSQKLGIDLQQNIYATNIYKNFFIAPPTQISEIDIFKAFLPAWLPLLKDELSQFDGVLVITLGEPVLNSLLMLDKPSHLRNCWGYTSEWKTGKFGSLNYIKPEENLLGRTIFPFPHQPSLRKQFYRDRMDRYVAFVRDNAFSK